MTSFSLDHDGRSLPWRATLKCQAYDETKMRDEHENAPSSPRPSLTSQSSRKSMPSLPITPSSAGGGLGLQYPLHEKFRNLTRAQRQDILIRTGAPIPVTRSNSMEDNLEPPKLILQEAEMWELRRDNSIMDRTTGKSLRRTTFSSCELDGAIIPTSAKSPALPHCRQSVVYAVPPYTAPTSKANHVLLHVYDLITADTLMQLPFGCICEIGKCFKELNDGLHLMGTGAYHVGIEINGIEYAFGACSTPGRSGVFPCTPKNSPGYQYRKSIDFGERAVVRRSNLLILQSDHSLEFEDEFEYLDGRDIVRTMAKEYLGTDYDILRKNCCTFARDACLRLGVKEKEIPNWFRNLSESGAMTHDLALSLASAEPLKVFSMCESQSEEKEAYKIMRSNVIASFD